MSSTNGGRTEASSARRVSTVGRVAPDPVEADAGEPGDGLLGPALGGDEKDVVPGGVVARVEHHRTGAAQTLEAGRVRRVRARHGPEQLPVAAVGVGAVREVAAGGAGAVGGEDTDLVGQGQRLAVDAGVEHRARPAPRRTGYSVTARRP
ncbi:hypothetical protein SRO_0541 [Streptomyces rochei]|nr:hypothetical protein SRO_0541 [Streptomyces rochei]